MTTKVTSGSPGSKFGIWLAIRRHAGNWRKNCATREAEKTSASGHDKGQSEPVQSLVAGFHVGGK